MSNKYYLFAVVSGFVCAQAYGKATLVNNQWQMVDGDRSGSIPNDTALYSHAIAELEDFKFTVTGSSAEVAPKNC